MTDAMRAREIVRRADKAAREKVKATRAPGYALAGDSASYDGFFRAELETEIAAALSSARAEERERCARVAEKMPNPILHIYARGLNDPPGNAYVPLQGTHVAAAIRAISDGGRT